MADPQPPPERREPRFYMATDAGPDVSIDTTARILALAGWRDGVFDTRIVESAVLRGWLAASDSAMDAERVLAACEKLLRRDGLRLDVGAPRRL